MKLIIYETETNRETTESNSWTYETSLGSTTGTSFLDTSNPYTGVYRCSYDNYPIVLRYTWWYEDRDLLRRHVHDRNSRAGRGVLSSLSRRTPPAYEER